MMKKIALLYLWLFDSIATSVRMSKDREKLKACLVSPLCMTAPLLLHA